MDFQVYIKGEVHFFSFFFQSSSQNNPLPSTRTLTEFLVSWFWLWGEIFLVQVQCTLCGTKSLFLLNQSYSNWMLKLGVIQYYRLFYNKTPSLCCSSQQFSKYKEGIFVLIRLTLKKNKKTKTPPPITSTENVSKRGSLYGQLGHEEHSQR